MAEKKKGPARMTSPKGTALWPHLCTPDDRFVTSGSKAKYKVDLALDEAAAAPLINAITPMVDEVFQDTLDNGGLKPQKKKELKRHYPWEDEYDKETEEATGRVIFKFSSNVSFQDKQGKEVSLKPKLFDGRGQLIGYPINIGNGSIIQVNFQPFPFYNAGNDKAGVSLRLNAVMVHKLVEYGASADGYGFETSEDGFDSSGFNTAAPDVQADEDMDPSDF